MAQQRQWYLDENWSMVPLPDGGGGFFPPYPADAGLVVDPERAMSPIWLDQDFSIYAYADEERESYGSGEFSIPRRWFVLWRKEPTPLAAEFVLERGIWACNQLVVARRPGANPITYDTLRNIKLSRIIEAVGPRAANRLIQRADAKLHGSPGLPGGGLIRWPVVYTEGGPEAYEAASQTKPRRGKRMSDEFLRAVADDYRAAALDRRNPTEHVAKIRGYARSTGAKWVTEARARGFLGPATRGRPGEKPPEDDRKEQQNG